MAVLEMERILLLVDDEENMLHALVRLLRRDGYTILTAGSGAEGLALAKCNKVGVIVSDQRMPEMDGTTFLCQVKEEHPDTIRIILSGYTDINCVTDAINRGAVYKFLTKPWEDELLRDNIRKAFESYELAHKNKMLEAELKIAHEALKITNEAQIHLSNISTKSLKIAYEILENLPLGMIGIGLDGIVTIVNQQAKRILNKGNEGMVGEHAWDVLPENIYQLCRTCSDQRVQERVNLNGTRDINASVYPLGVSSGARGVLLLLGN